MKNKKDHKLHCIALLSLVLVKGLLFSSSALAHPVDKFPCDESIEGDCDRTVVSGYFDASNPQEFPVVDPKGERLETWILSTEAENYPDWWAATIQEAHTRRVAEWLATQTAECVGQVKAYSKALREAAPAFTSSPELNELIYDHQTRKPDGIANEAALTGECTWRVWEFVRDHDGAGTVADLILNSVAIKAVCVAEPIDMGSRPKWFAVSRSACETIREHINRANTLLYTYFIPCLLDRLRQEYALAVPITRFPTGIPHTTVPLEDDLWFTLDLEKHWCGNFIE